MDKPSFKERISSIEVPEEELSFVIDHAIKRGTRTKKLKKKSLISLSITAIVASCFLLTGFLFSPMTKVLAEVPLIGSIYSLLNMEMGTILEEKKLVTSLNQTVSDQGMDVTVTSIYFDGTYIGITFKVDGEGLSKVDASLGYSQYQYLDQGVKVGLGGAVGDLLEVDNHLESAIEFQLPNKEISKDFTLPIIFELIGGVEGNWQLELKESQLPVKAYEVSNKTTHDEKYFFTLDSLGIGESNIRVLYSTDIPMDDLSIAIFDDKGNEISKDTHRLHGNDTAIFSAGINEKTSYLFIHPTYLLSGELMQLEPIQVFIKH